MSSVESPRPFSHWQFGFDNPHALGEGRLSPLSYDLLVAIPPIFPSQAAEVLASSLQDSAANTTVPPGET